MVASAAVESIINPLATAEQLAKLRNTETDNDVSVRYALGQLTSTAGVLLRLPQELIAYAIVLLQRFLVSSTLSDRENIQPKTYCAAAIYTAAKISATPVSPRSVINVYAYLTSSGSPLRFINPSGAPNDVDPLSYYVSEGTYEKERQRLFFAESAILAAIGFDMHVALPYGLALTYLQALSASSAKLTKRVFEHLNGGLLSPQLLYLTHQPNAIAVAAIYLAAKDVGVKLVDQNWWEVFDVDREDLGFLVLALGSLNNFAAAEAEKWEGRALSIC